MTAFVRTIRKQGDLLVISIPTELHEHYPQDTKVQVTMKKLEPTKEEE